MTLRDWIADEMGSAQDNYREAVKDRNDNVHNEGTYIKSVEESAHHAGIICVLVRLAKALDRKEIA